MTYRLINTGYNPAGASYQRLGSMEFIKEDDAVIYAMEKVPEGERRVLQIHREDGSLMKLDAIMQRYSDIKAASF